jgi:hypothetical protein
MHGALCDGQNVCFLSNRLWGVRKDEMGQYKEKPYGLYPSALGGRWKACLPSFTLASDGEVVRCGGGVKVGFLIHQ